MELVVATLIVVSCIAGAFIGVVVYDLADRKRSRDDLAKAKQEVSDLVKSIHEAHNSMAQQIVKLQDQVQAQELRGLKR